MLASCKYVVFQFSSYNFHAFSKFYLLILNYFYNEKKSTFSFKLSSGSSSLENWFSDSGSHLQDNH